MFGNVVYNLNDLAYTLFHPSFWRKWFVLQMKLNILYWRLSSSESDLFTASVPWHVRWEYNCKCLITRPFPSTYWTLQSLGTVKLFFIQEILFRKYTKHVSLCVSMWNTIFCVLCHIFMFPKLHLEAPIALSTVAFTVWVFYTSSGLSIHPFISYVMQYTPYVMQYCVYC